MSNVNLSSVKRKNLSLLQTCVSRLSPHVGLPVFVKWQAHTTAALSIKTLKGPPLPVWLFAQNYSELNIFETCAPLPNWVETGQLTQWLLGETHIQTV